MAFWSVRGPKADGRYCADAGLKAANVWLYRVLGRNKEGE